MELSRRLGEVNAVPLAVGPPDGTTCDVGVRTALACRGWRVRRYRRFKCQRGPKWPWWTSPVSGNSNIRTNSLSEAYPSASAPGDFARVQGALARAHRDNHHLPLRAGVPTPAQIAATEQALQVLLRSLQASASESHLLRAGLTVRLGLDLGRHEEHLSRLSRIHVDKRRRTPPDAWGLVSWKAGNETKYGWWLQAGVHIGQNGPDQANEIRGSVWLPLLERSAPWLSLAGLIGDLRSRSLLDASPEGLKNDVATFKAWAKTTLGALGNSIPKTGRLPCAVTEQLAWYPTGDRTLAMQLTGRDIKHSNARAYYTSVPVRRAAKHYADAMRSPISKLSRSVSADGTVEIALPTFTGSAMTRKEPKGSLENAQEEVSRPTALPDQEKHHSEIVVAHNALVTKLWIVLALSTAARGVNKWVPGRQLIEPRTGALMVLDKRRAADKPRGLPNFGTQAQSPEQARLVILHPAVREMLSYYTKNLRGFAKRSTFDERSRELMSRHVDALEGDGLQPFLVLERGWKDNFSCVFAFEAGANWIEAALEKRLGHQRNFARHSLRSGLLGYIPQSAIDAMLGHFDRGTEPWSNGSALG